MRNSKQFYVGGEWVEPEGQELIDVVNPSDETVVGQIASGTAKDVDKAVNAARSAFETFRFKDRKYKLELLSSIISEYNKRIDDLAEAVSTEMGAPFEFARNVQVWIGDAHLSKMRDVLESYEFEYRKPSGLVVKEPVGVVGMITPWNWPLNQITCKVAPALAAGCTMVLKPSEVAPLNAIIFAEIMDAAGVPAGVFNLVNGSGAVVGEAMSAHPGIDMMSFTGSTRAGIQVAKGAAEGVKRVHQELGGKSANILLPDVDLVPAVKNGVAGCYLNAGQSCNAPTRMFVPRERQAEALEIAREAAEEIVVGEAANPTSQMGPVVSQAQFDKIQDLIRSGIEEGATLVCGGPDRPEGRNAGYFIRPTVFGDVTPGMRIAREEIFGPVLSILPYDTVEQAFEMAEDTEYGLASYVQSADKEAALALARRLRSGQVHVNYPDWSPDMPFSGYKKSGNGHEYAEFGLSDYLETKGILVA